jgi:quinoprotein glucose dehydrogenase
VTAGGLVFIGATSFDRKFRAFDKDTSELLWETTLPCAGSGTPATYGVDGRDRRWRLARTAAPRQVG